MPFCFSAIRPGPAAEVCRTVALALKRGGIAGWQHEADWLVAETTGMESLLELRLERDRVLGAADCARLREMVRRRLAGWPLQYVTGTAGFHDLDLAVGPGVLIPRPETECLVSRALEHDPGAGAVCDVCTGSGAVGFALARRLSPGRPVVCVDRSARALAWASFNRRRLSLSRVFLVQADLLVGFAPSARFGLIVSNPPYVSERSYRELPPEVRDHEPAAALRAPEGGLGVFRRLSRQVPRHLRPGGWFLAEISPEQAETACRILGQSGFSTLCVYDDLNGRARVVAGRAP